MHGTGQWGSSCWLLVSCTSFWLCLMPLLVVRGSKWTFPCSPVAFHWAIWETSVIFIQYIHIYVCVCDIYITQILSLKTSNLHNYCLYGNCSCFFHTLQCTRVFFFLSSYLKKNTELQTAFRIYFCGLAILVSVHVIIFNSSFVLTVDEHWAEIFISLISKRSNFSVLQLT